MGGSASGERAPRRRWNRRSAAMFALFGALLLGSRWYYGPQRVPEGAVVIYGAAWCPYTKALGEHLAASGVAFEERDIDGSFANFQRYLWAAGRKSSIPVVQVGPHVVAKGYYRRPIDEALRRAGYRPADDASGPEGSSARR